MILYLLVGIVLAAACVGLVGHAIALPRLRALAYGFATQADVLQRPGAVTGLFDQLAKALGSLLAGRLQGLSEADSKRQLMAAGMYRTAPATPRADELLASLLNEIVQFGTW